MKSWLAFVFLVALATGISARAGSAQTPAARAAVLAVTDSALAAINRGDTERLTELMIPEGFAMPVSDSTRYGLRSREELREQEMRGITERGFSPVVQISGPLATVWLPYDLYVDGAWSHCGIDALTLVRTGGAWKIAVFAWTIEQPPACQPHPEGPPQGQRVR